MFSSHAVFAGYLLCGYSIGESVLPILHPVNKRCIKKTLTGNNPFGRQAMPGALKVWFLNL